MSRAGAVEAAHSFTRIRATAAAFSSISSFLARRQAARWIPRSASRNSVAAALHRPLPQ